MKKQAIIELIEQGLSDREISDKTGKPYSGVKVIRSDYNKLAAHPIRSKRKPLSQPKSGTQCRLIYDFMKSNPDVSWNKAALILGFDGAAARYVHSRYIQREAA